MRATLYLNLDPRQPKRITAPTLEALEQKIRDLATAKKSAAADGLTVACRGGYATICYSEYTKDYELYETDQDMQLTGDGPIEMGSLDTVLASFFEAMKERL